MYGAVIGDIVGSRFEFDNIKTKDFEFFDKECDYTDDTIMTVAVADALMKGNGVLDEEIIVRELQEYGKRYPSPKGGYGTRFRQWLFSADPEPYNSFGNGSAMRVSPCGFYASCIDEALNLANQSAVVTHSHYEGIHGAQAVAAAVYLAKTGHGKGEIKDYIENNFYELNFSIDEIRSSYKFSEACQDSVPQAITAFLESVSFEDAVRNAISIGGDSDTLGDIAGAIAWAYYQDKEDLSYYEAKAREYLPGELTDTIDRFVKFCGD